MCQGGIVSPTFYLWWSWQLRNYAIYSKLIGGKARLVTENLHLQQLHFSRYYTRTNFWDYQEPRLWSLYLIWRIFKTTDISWKTTAMNKLISVEIGKFHRNFLQKGRGSAFRQSMSVFVVLVCITQPRTQVCLYILSPTMLFFLRL